MIRAVVRVIPTRSSHLFLDASVCALPDFVAMTTRHGTQVGDRVMRKIAEPTELD